VQNGLHFLRRHVENVGDLSTEIPASRFSNTVSTGYGSDPVDVSCAALSQFRVRGRVPGPGRKPEGLALFVAPDVAPEEIDDIGGAWLMFGSGHAVELVGKFFWYLDGAWHGSLRRASRSLPA
jgi:hypothetical protein